MNEDRIIRISFPGIFFLVSFCTFDWILGGEILKDFFSQDSSKIDAITGAIAFIVSTPVLGFVISSFYYTILFWLPSWRFIIPQETTKRRQYLQALSNLYIHSIHENMDSKGITTIHQQVLRMKMKDEELGYISRRFTFYLTYSNTIVALVFSFIIALLIHDWTLCYVFNGIKLVLVLFYVLYIIIAVWLAYRNLSESSDFEVQWVLFYDRERDNGIRHS